MDQELPTKAQTGLPPQSSLGPRLPRPMQWALVVVLAFVWAFGARRRGRGGASFDREHGVQAN